MNEGTPQLRLHTGSATDRGLRREINEDSLVAVEPLFAVADGMGGHEAGEVASEICIRTLSESELGLGSRPGTTTELQEVLHLADANIRAATDGRAGTTVSGVLLVAGHQGPSWLVFNVGDSRTYRMNSGAFERVTVDHSEVQELVDAGEITEAQALFHPRRHVVTRALGTGTDCDADFWQLPVQPGDRLLICSDGLTGELSDEHICDILSAAADPQAAADELVRQTLEAGARDNVTVIVVDALTDTDQPA